MSQVIDAVRIRVPRTEVGLAWVEIVPPDLRTALSAVSAGQAVVVVPLLLSSGYHDRVDIPAAVDGSRSPVARAAVLGPHPLLAAALADRLEEAGWAAGDAVVLAAAGSSDPDAVESVREQAELLAAELGRRTAVGPTGPTEPTVGRGSGGAGEPARVTVGFGSAAAPDVATAVAQARADGARRVGIAPYLLAPGFFSSILQDAGGDLVAAPLGAHPAVVELVVQRYAHAARQLTVDDPGSSPNTSATPPTT